MYISHPLNLLRRITRGRSPTSNRPIYGYDVGCTCGWRVKLTGTKRDAIGAHAEHARASPGLAPEPKP